MNVQDLLSMLRFKNATVLIGVFSGAMTLASSSTCHAQLTPRRITTATDDRVATLEEQLINQLRATTEDRKAYIRMVVQLVNDGTFQQPHVIAIQRYAMRRNPTYPFPYFERAMRFESEKIGITLPPVQLLAGSRSTQ